MSRLVLRLLGLVALAPLAGAMTVRESRVAATVSEQSCTAPKAASAFPATERQVFLWFVAQHVRAGDLLSVEWLDPSGAIATTANYGELPNAAELCFVTQMPVAGFAPASQPGRWTVRAVANGVTLFSRDFAIGGTSDEGGPVVTSVTWSGVVAQETDFTVQGKNFQPGALVFIAQYKSAGGWSYLASLQPHSITANQLSVHYPGLPANEYLVIVENPDQRLSRPMPFVISTAGYKLPIPAGEPWVITQGPYGTFSHWGNSLHAWDIAPRTGNCVVAMKSGIAYTHDMGLQQDHLHRTFGNYITIDHGNGEYSHYAHLATGTFVVQNGERVEQGQALATAGNSGYTLGEGGGYHLHVSVTRSLAISASSVPFQFDDLPAVSRGSVYRTVVSTNASPYCNCSERHGKAGGVVAGVGVKPARQFSGQVSVEQWWTALVAVPRGAKSFDVTLSWTGASNDLDLHLMSPDGRHFGWYGDTSGFQSSKGNPEQFHLAKPPPGVWRISVQGIRGGPGPIEFGIATSGIKTGPQLQATR